VEQVLVPALVMVGATLLTMLVIPLGFLAVSGVYFARRTAIWLVPMLRRSAADARRSAADLGARVVHSRLPQALVIGALGCALAVPAFAAPVRDMEPGWGRYPQPGLGGLAGDRTEPAVQIGECCGGQAARPAEEQGTNQVRFGPAPGPTARSVTPVDQCSGSCGRQSEKQGKSKNKKSKSDKKSKSKA
jgi:hypothetical protein